MMYFQPKRFAAFVLAVSLGVVPAHAGCITPPASAEELDAFKKDPAALLTRFQMGSGSMASAIRIMAASDAGVLGAIAGLVKTANKAQKSAIAAGMAHAASACRTQDPALALQIQEAMAGVDDADVLTQFAAISGDTRTAATGGGGAGGGGAGGGGGGGGGASGLGNQNGGANNVANPGVGGSTGATPLSAPSFSAGVFSTTTTTITTAATAASPSQ
jgi:hypothetical protein